LADVLVTLQKCQKQKIQFSWKSCKLLVESNNANKIIMNVLKHFLTIRNIQSMKCLMLG